MSDNIPLIRELFWTCFVTWRAIWPLVLGLFHFSYHLAHYKGLGLEEKTRLSFLMTLFKKELNSFKIMSCMQWLFWVIYQNLIRFGTSFWCIFSAWFFHKNVPCLIIHQLTMFQCFIFFLSQDIKRNVLLSSYLVNWWHHEL